MVHKTKIKDKWGKWIESEITKELHTIPIDIRKIALKKDYAFDVVYDHVRRDIVLTIDKNTFKKLLKKSVR